MRDEYDFSDAKRENPYIEKIQQHGYAIVINCGAAQENSTVSDDDPPVDSVAEYTTKYSAVND